VAFTAHPAAEVFPMALLEVPVMLEVIMEVPITRVSLRQAPVMGVLSKTKHESQK
jgi:hypothetical protein